MKKYIFLAAAAGAILALAWQAPRAQGSAKRTSVAVIADISGNVRWASDRKGRPDLLDELYAGDILRAPKGSRVVLVYFEGCLKETITGAATADIGRVSSIVIGPDQVKAGKTKCERRKAVLSKDSGGTAQGLIIASLPPGKGGGNGSAFAEESAAGSLGGASAGARMGTPGADGSLISGASAPMASLTEGTARGKRASAAKLSAADTDSGLARTSRPAKPAAAPKAELAEMEQADAIGGDTSTREEYRRAAEKAPDDLSKRLAYAAYLENTGEFKEALVQYKKVLDARPRSAAVRKRCEELEAKINSAGR